MTSDKNEVYRILQRIQAASGPDRAVDRELMALSYVWTRRHIGAQEDSGPRGAWTPVEDNVWVDPATDKWVTTAIHGFEFTGSLDRAVQLVQRILPGLVWTVSNSDGDGYRMARIRVAPLLSIEGREATVPLALLSAALQAWLHIEAAR